MYLLIPCCRLLFPLVADNLHPTMYLLIRKFFTTYKRVSVFTSHYVSINSQEQRQTVRDGIYLHPTMYLLIL